MLKIIQLYKLYIIIYIYILWKINPRKQSIHQWVFLSAGSSHTFPSPSQPPFSHKEVMFTPWQGMFHPHQNWKFQIFGSNILVLAGLKHQILWQPPFLAGQKSSRSFPKTLLDSWDQAAQQPRLPCRAHRSTGPVLVGRWLLSRKKLDQWEFQDPEMEVLYHTKTIYIYIYMLGAHPQKHSLYNGHWKKNQRFDERCRVWPHLQTSQIECWSITNYPEISCFFPTSPRNQRHRDPHLVPICTCALRAAPSAATFCDSTCAASSCCSPSPRRPRARTSEPRPGRSCAGWRWGGVQWDLIPFHGFWSFDHEKNKNHRDLIIT